MEDKKETGLDDSLSKQFEAAKKGEKVKAPKPKKPIIEETPSKPETKPKVYKPYEVLRIRDLRKYARKHGVRHWNTKPRLGLLSALRSLDKQGKLK